MVETLKDLDKLFKLCRKHGVYSLAIKDLSFSLNEQKANNEQSEVQEESIEDTYKALPQNPTEEDLMYYSSGALKDED